MLRLGLAAAIALVLVLCMQPARTVLAPIAIAAELPAAVPDMYLQLPARPAALGPVQVLVALHGMGGSGAQFASEFTADAERNGWLLIAPTIGYGDWSDPAQIATEDPRLIAWLSGFIDHLSDYAGVAVKPRVLLVGHSRGAQLAHRFALFEPDRVLGVAALAAGTYTLPLERTTAGAMLRFPFGLGDLQTIAGHPFARSRMIDESQFWLGVGSDDNNPADLPRAWDNFLGTTRVQRAQTFQDALHAVGARSVLVGFAGGHALSRGMASSAASFLHTIDVSAAAVDASQPLARPRAHVRPHF